MHKIGIEHGRVCILLRILLDMYHAKLSLSLVAPRGEFWRYEEGAVRWAHSCYISRAAHHPSSTHRDPSRFTISYPDHTYGSGSNRPGLFPSWRPVSLMARRGEAIGPKNARYFGIYNMQRRIAPYPSGYLAYSATRHSPLFGGSSYRAFIT